VSDLLDEVGRFRRWADRCDPAGRGGEWECDYPGWDRLYNAVLDFVESRPFARWSAWEVEAVLYAIARDNEDEHLVEEIRDGHPELLLPLARTALAAGERDARWQLAECLGHAGISDGEAPGVLSALANDPDEYVRRRSLRALARLGSPLVEELAAAEWERSGDAQEYARMNVLWCLQRVGSPLLHARLAEAERDSRPYLSRQAAEIREGRAPDL
jgi:HEAT repeat protein